MSTTPQPIAWETTRTRDGKQTLEKPFVATNPAYVERHAEWEWIPQYKPEAKP